MIRKQPNLGLRRFTLLMALWLSTFSTLRVFAAAADPVINVMAPLFIGDPNDETYLRDLNLRELNHRRPTKYDKDWENFRAQLQQMRAIGVVGVSVDLWWGVVQRQGPNSYDWSYYRRLFELIKEEKMSIKVIMSTHQCGSNVGDNVYIPLPKWIFKELAGNHANDLRYESEVGNRTDEYISLWATDRVMPYYQSFWSSFLGEFRDLAQSFNAISISLGPSGELHFPSYHRHDAGYREANWPFRGFFQGSSDLAFQDYQIFLKQRFKTLEDLNQAFRSSYSDWDKVFFPKKINSNVFSQMLHSDWLQRPESVALFDWYAGSLLHHMKEMLENAADLVWRDPDFGKTPISLKIPGIHWEEAHLAEIMNGLISVSSLNAGKDDLGYGPLFQAIADIEKAYTGHHFEIYSTAGSIPDGIVGGQFSRGESIVRAQALLAKKLGLVLKLENAMASDLSDPERLKVLDKNFSLVGSMVEKTGLTLLRISDVVASEAAQKKCEDWLKQKKAL